MPRILYLEGAAVNTAYTVNTASTPDVTGPPFTPGTTAIGTDASEWLFVKLAASQTIAAGDYVYVSTPSTFVVTSLSNTAKALLGAFVGVAGAAATSGTTSYEYIWIQRAGYNATTAAATSSTANTAMHTSATAGRLNSGGSAGVTATVDGVVLTATAASNVAAAMLNYPTIGVAD